MFLRRLEKPQDKSTSTPFGTILNVAKLKQDGKFTFSFACISGQKNAYYRVRPIAVTAAETQTFTFSECKSANLPVEDKEAVELAKRPWSKDNPFDFLEKEPWSAFGLAINTEPALFVKDDPTVIGVQFQNVAMHSRRGRAYPASSVVSWPPVKPGAKEVTQKIWYPDPKPGEDLPPGTKSDLVELLRSARADEVILIKHDGLLQIPETIELKPRTGTTEFHVTFKPVAGYKPILTTPPPPKMGESLLLEQSLFKLTNGEVTFEGIQFLLRPTLPRNPFKVAAVTIVGGKGCTFTDCVFTLAEDDEQIAAVVKVADPDKIMMAMAEGASRPVPEIAIKQCVIRGKGRGVWVEASRAVKVKLSQTLTAIDGPMILTEPAGKMMAGAKSSLELSHVTAFVGGPVLEMKGGKVGEMLSNGLIPFEVHADDCLFSGVPGAGKPLVELDGIDPSDMKSVLDWNIVKNGNHYANFEEGTAAVVVRPGSDGMMQKETSWLEWFPFAREPAANGNSMMKLMFALAPTNLKELSAIKPKNIALREISDMKLEELGVNWKLLPVPEPMVR